MDKKITVIVPVYNTKKFLKRCIMSIMNQSYSNLEIIIINDGSTDGSEKICNELEKADERIRVIHQKNNGIAATRNIGIENATGQYISFVDSDDYLTKDAIEWMVSKVIESDADIVTANTYYKNEELKVMLPERLYTGSEIKEVLVTHMMGNYAKRIDAISYTATAKLFKKKIFDENNLRFPSERRLIWEDLAFSTEAYPLCEKVYISHKPVYYYCFNEGSLTHTYRQNKLELVMVLYCYMKEKIKKLNLPDEAQFRLDTNFIGHIRTCIKLEVFYANLNGHKRAIQNIREICFRKDVQTLLRNYPKASFNKSQYIYNIAIKHKWAYLVYLLTWLQNKKKRIE